MGRYFDKDFTEKFKKKLDDTLEEQFTAFGNYLLSDERKERTSELNQGKVTEADFLNWKQSLDTGK